MSILDVLPDDLIATALFLVEAKKGKPRQADLRRAVSTAYYAMFHTLAKCCADLLVGRKTKRAWRQAYRSLDHGPTRAICENKSALNPFPDAIKNFAHQFIEMQIKRNNADYDPEERLYKSAVKSDILLTQIFIEQFNRAPAKDRRAFAALVSFRRRTS